MKIYSAIYQDDAHLAEFGKVKTIHQASQMDEPGILILHGGADISPSIYGKTPNNLTQASTNLSDRDLTEVMLAKHAIKNNIPIFGICRGAQLSCALAGGTLVQHVTGHFAGGHAVETKDGQRYWTSTCHHQMMNPTGSKYELLAWSAPNRSTMYLGEEGEELEVTVEPEVVYYPEIKALAIQGHPEWMDRSTPFVEYCLSLVKEKLLNVSL